MEKVFFKFKIFPILISFIFLLVAFPVLADIVIDNPLQTDTFEGFIEAIVNFIFWIAIALVPLVVIIGAFYFVTSGGDPRKIQTAKDIILYTFIGLLIILLAKGIIGAIKAVLGTH